MVCVLSRDEIVSDRKARRPSRTHLKCGFLRFRYKNGKQITESERVKITKNVHNSSHRLRIEDATVEDEGSYSVVASNEVNKCTDFCTVKVTRPAPEFLKEMKDNVQVSEGEEITFEIEVSEGSAPNVTW